MRLHLILAVMTAMATSACSMLPADKLELLHSAPQSKQYCYSDQLSVVTQRIRSYLFSCYRPFSSVTSAPVGGTFVAVPTNIYWDTEEEIIPSGTQFTVRGTYGYYVLGAQVTGPTQSCPAVLKVFAGNRFWTDRYETLDKIARGESATCPYK